MNAGTYRVLHIGYLILHIFKHTLIPEHYSMKTLFILSTIPIVSALIGWLTNCLAVKMIFRPRKPLRIAWFTLVGLIPKRKAALARTIGETVEKELISHHDIHRVVTSARFQEQMLDAIIARVEEFIYTTLGSAPLVAVALSGETAWRIKELVRGELRKTMPAIVENLFEKVESQLDFKEIIRVKIEAFDLSRFEAIVYTIASRELKAIERIGGILGFLVGVGQVGFLVLLNALK
jgi:uncharacterized membrane protein YheB (UPF0754 family)